MAISKEILDTIRNKVDIVEYISDYVDLVKRSDSYLGNCPFHADNSPSFRVHPKKGIFKCFGCGVGGSVITFAMKYHELSFYEAVSSLAQIVGIQLDPEDAEVKVMYDINLRLSILFRDKLESLLNNQLPGIPNTLMKLHDVGIADELYSVGPIAICKALGLINENGGKYFHDRLMFPIHNPSGQVAGFYGRDLSGRSNLKHLTSKTSPIFHKGRLLYNFHIAKAYIRGTRKVFLVEGPKDVLAFEKVGITNVVATCGTALTQHHIKLLKSSADEVILAYDNDPGGITSALSNAKALLESDLAISFQTFPPGDDPYSYIVEKDQTLGPVISPVKMLVPNGRPRDSNEFLNTTKAVIDLIKSARSRAFQHVMMQEAADTLEVSLKFLNEAVEESYKFEIESKPILDIKTEPWQQLIIGLAYAPQWAPEIRHWLDLHLSTGYSFRYLLDLMVDNQVLAQTEWLDFVASHNLDIPASSPILDLLTEEEIKEYITVAARTIVGSMWMDRLKQAIASGEAEQTERIREWLAQLPTLTVM